MIAVKLDLINIGGTLILIFDPNIIGLMRDIQLEVDSLGSSKVYCSVALFVG